MRAEFDNKRSISTRSVEKMSMSNLYRVGETPVDKAIEKKINVDHESPTRLTKTHEHWISYSRVPGEDEAKNWFNESRVTNTRVTQNGEGRVTFPRSEFVDSRGTVSSQPQMPFFESMVVAPNTNVQFEENLMPQRKMSDADRLKSRRKDSAVSKECDKLDRPTKRDVNEIRVLVTPPTPIVKITTAIMMLIDPESILRVSSIENINLWNECRIMMQNSCAFLDELRNFKYMYVTRDTYFAVKAFVNSNSEYFDVKLISNCDLAAYGMLHWIVTMIRVIELYHEYHIVKVIQKQEPIVLPPAPRPVVVVETKVEPKPEPVVIVKRINKNLVLDILLRQLNSIHRLDVEEVRVFKRPTPPVYGVLRALPMIFKPELNSLSNESEEFWMKHIRLLLENGPGFYKELKEFHWEYMERSTYDYLAAYIDKNAEYFIYVNSEKNCHVVPGICRWIITIKNIYEVTHDIWPTDPNFPDKKWPLLEVFDEVEESIIAEAKEDVVSTVEPQPIIGYSEEQQA